MNPNRRRSQSGKEISPRISGESLNMATGNQTTHQIFQQLLIRGGFGILPKLKQTTFYRETFYIGRNIVHYRCCCPSQQPRGTGKYAIFEDQSRWMTENSNTRNEI